MIPLRSLARALVPAPQRRLIRALLHAGTRVRCPCCGWSFRRFRTAGVRPRPNARCPRCGAYERQRLLWLYLCRRTELLRVPHRLLHFAPEESLQRRLRAVPGLTYVGADLKSPHASVRVDLGSLPFADAAFDAVLCVHVLNHLPDDARGLAEIRRVLRPGGWAILHSPIEPGRARTIDVRELEPAAERDYYGREMGYVRVFGADYARRLEAAGFLVRVEPFARELPPDLVRRHALPDEDIHVAFRPRSSIPSPPPPAEGAPLCG